MTDDDLPDGWRWTTFREVAEVASDLVDPRATPDAIHIAPNHIESWTGRLIDRGTVAGDEVKSPKHRFHPGQVLYSKIRPYLAKAALADCDGLCSADMYPIDARVGVIEAQFLLAWMLTPEFTEAASGRQGRTVLPKINQEALNELAVPVAPLDEQRRIVAKLDALRARSRRAKDALDAVPALLDRLRQSILAAAFRGDLTADWREQNPDVEPASELLKRIPFPPRPARYDSRSIAVIPGDSALSVGKPDAPAPRGWSWVPLVDIARLESGHTPSRRHPEWWGGDIPWIGLRDASEHHGGTITETRQYTNEAGLANSAARLLPAGTVCLSRTATIGYSFVMGREMATSQDFANWVCTDAVDPHWLKLLFAAEKQALLRFSAQSTNIATIYYPSLIAFHVCLPPVEEQREMVRRVSEHMARVNIVRSSVDTAGEALANLDRAVLDKAFRGELLDRQSDRPPAVHEQAQ